MTRTFSFFLISLFFQGAQCAYKTHDLETTKAAEEKTRNKSSFTRKKLIFSPNLQVVLIASKRRAMSRLSLSSSLVISRGIRGKRQSSMPASRTLFDLGGFDARHTVGKTWTDRNGFAIQTAIRHNPNASPARSFGLFRLFWGRALPGEGDGRSLFNRRLQKLIFASLRFLSQSHSRYENDFSCSSFLWCAVAVRTEPATHAAVRCTDFEDVDSSSVPRGWLLLIRP